MFVSRRELSDLYYLLTFGFLSILVITGLLFGAWFSPWSYKNCTQSNECDDLNPCTKDVCKNFMCTHNLIEGVSCSNDGSCEENQICTESCECTSNLTLHDFTSNLCNSSLCNLDEIITVTSLAQTFSLPGNITTHVLIDSIKVAPEMKTGNQRFGSSVVSCGEHMFVGSERRDGMDGAVYIYKITEDDFVLMSFETQILPGPSSSNFGFSISISENCTYLVVGAPDLDPMNRGGFLIFQRNESGVEVQYDLFQTVTTSSTSDLGESIDISNSENLTIVSGDSDSDNAKVFDYNPGMDQWELSQTITGNDTMNNDLFGSSVDILGDLLVIGAPNENSRGAAYIFEFDGLNWVNIQKIIGSDQQNGDEFGSCVAFFENYIVVGTPNAERNGVSSGGVYLFKNNITSPSSPIYLEVDSVFPESLGNSALFGTSCSFNNEGLLIIGAPDYDVVSGNNIGIAIVYSINENDELEESYRLENSDTVVANGRIGSSVFISDNLTIAGAPTYNIGGVSSGIVLVRLVDVPVSINISVDCIFYFPTTNSIRSWCKGDVIGQFNPGVYFIVIDGSSLPFNSSAIIDTWFTFTAYGTTRGANSLISVSNPQLSPDTVFTAFLVTYGLNGITVVANTIRQITGISSLMD